MKIILARQISLFVTLVLTSQRKEVFTMTFQMGDSKEMYWHYWHLTNSKQSTIFNYIYFYVHEYVVVANLHVPSNNFIGSN